MRTGGWRGARSAACSSVSRVSTSDRRGSPTCRENTFLPLNSSDFVFLLVFFYIYIFVRSKKKIVDLQTPGWSSSVPTNTCCWLLPPGQGRHAAPVRRLKKKKKNNITIKSPSSKHHRERQRRGQEVKAALWFEFQPLLPSSSPPPPPPVCFLLAEKNSLPSDSDCGCNQGLVGRKQRGR